MANQILIKNALLISDGRELFENELVVENGRIHSVGAGESAEYGRVIDLEGQILTPGLIDIQINGGYTKYFSLTPDAETIAEVTEACLEHATPFFYITLISSPIETIFTAIDAVRIAMQSNPHLLGMHLEGPFLNPIRKGAHNAQVICSPTLDTLRDLIEYGRGVVRMITLAPEIWSTEAIDLVLGSGIQVSLGHSEATYDQAMALFDRGVHIVTHLYNAMSAFTHRSPGLVGASLEHPEVYTPVILDGRHCHPAAARLAYRLKEEHFILLTDAAVLGRRMKEMAWEGLHAILTPDGYYVNPDGNLAGSAISMPEAVGNAMLYLDATFAEAVDMATRRVARAIGLESELGRIAEGYQAAFSVFSPDLSSSRTLSLLS
ncbi:MAG: N-acetylglucosamine-6-phosphate deacetylase [Porphyromonadaceae bacterium]|nr:N-acetylglucosamine-6-phosphate deacetylase [Porphyromonadaceae bacterium]